MKIRIYFILTVVAFYFACTPKPHPTRAQETTTFSVDLNDRADDLFKVEVQIPHLGPENKYYQFAATAPGTYQTMDIGRFVRSFDTFDRNNNHLKVEQVSVNRWQFNDPEKVARIEYKIAETWDTPVDSNRIYKMCGSSLEDDHALINGQAVFGYVAGKQHDAIEINLEYPENWLVGTALEKNSSGDFIAKSYDQLVDSPIQLGHMSQSSTWISDTKIDVYSYSKTDLVQAEDILQAMEKMLHAAQSFIGKLPVKHYTFLYHFEDTGAGAWEHSYSSGYVFQEREFEKIKKSIIRTSAHEFFHIITPLNIHSEIIENYNFSKPTVSRHLWLYEGTTEWAAQIMLLRGKLQSLEDYFSSLRRKVAIDKMYYRQDYSLTDLAENSFSTKGARQYGNIYMRGAVVATLLDILLLDSSDGERGLRDLLNELARDYGPTRPFSENGFFDELTKRTDPEVGKFIDKYIKNAAPLPIAEYYEKIGISYQEKADFTDKVLGFGGTDGRFYILNPGKELQDLNIKNGDIFVKIDGKEIRSTSMRRLQKKLQKSGNNKIHKLVLERDGQKIVIQSSEKAFVELLQKFTDNFRKLMIRGSYAFSLIPEATARQKKLRQAWLSN